MRFEINGVRWTARAWMLWLVLAVSIGPAEAGYRQVNKVNPKDPMAVRIYRLDNGLTVYLTENHETPRFEAQIAVRAGSKHDPAESTGLAHYLEHMLFKGTQKFGTIDYQKERVHLDRITQLYEDHFKQTDPEKRKAIYAEINRETQLAAAYAIPNEMDRLYGALGEEGLNAHTYHEETVYKVSLPANRLEQWAVIESERFQNPVFRLFQPELEIVYEEKNQTLDSKERLIHYAVNEVLFKKHPYGQQTTIGKVEHLKNPSLKNMYDYFHRHYVPGNMAILISGDIRPEETMKVIDRYFSVWKAGPVPEVGRWEEEPLKGAERVTVKFKGEEYVMLAFRTPGRRHADAEALQLIDMILNNSTAGLIDLNLNQSQKVRRAGSSPELNNDYGSESLWGIPKRGQSLKEVEDLLLSQIERVRKGEFEDWIIPAIITDFKKNYKAQLESDAARVGLMREAFLAFEEWDVAIGEIERMEKLTKADVIRVANRYFGSGYVAGYRVDQEHDVPKIEKPAIDKIAIDPTRQSEFIKRVMAMPVQEIRPVWVKAGKDYRRSPAGAGVDLYHVKNPLNDLFVLSITVDVGTRHDRRLAVAAQLLDKSGAGSTSADDLKKRWYRLGTDFSVRPGDNETAIVLTGLDENFEESVGLMMELLTRPAVAAGTLDELKQIILAQREDARKDARTIASAVALYNRYGTNSNYLRLMPGAELLKLGVEELQGLTRGLLGYRHTVSYTGSLPVNRVRALLQDRVRLPGKLREPPAYVAYPLESPASDRIYFFDKPMAQAQLRLEFGDGEYRESDQVVAQAFNEYFGGGMSGIVFQELREARALAYSAYALYGSASRREEPNMMMGFIGCQADKTPESLGAFLELFDNLPASPERFEAVRDSLTTRYRTGKLGFREVVGAVRGWERLGLKGDPRPARFEALRRLELDDVIAFQKAHVKGRPKMISIVGERSKVGADQLAKVAPVRELKLEDLFAF